MTDFMKSELGFSDDMIPFLYPFKEIQYIHRGYGLFHIMCMISFSKAIHNAKALILHLILSISFPP